HLYRLADLDLAWWLVEAGLRDCLEVLLHDRLPDLHPGVATTRALQEDTSRRHPINLHTAPPVVALAPLRERLLGVVHRDHGHAGDLRCIAGEPHGLIAVDRSGLAGDVPAVVDLGAFAGALVDHGLQDFVHAVRDVLVDHSP